MSAPSWWDKYAQEDRKKKREAGSTKVEEIINDKLYSMGYKFSGPFPATITGNELQIYIDSLQKLSTSPKNKKQSNLNLEQNLYEPIQKANTLIPKSAINKISCNSPLLQIERKRSIKKPHINNNIEATADNTISPKEIYGTKNRIGQQDIPQQRQRENSIINKQLPSFGYQNQETQIKLKYEFFNLFFDEYFKKFDITLIYNDPAPQYMPGICFVTDFIGYLNNSRRKLQSIQSNKIHILFEMNLKNKLVDNNYIECCTILHWMKTLMASTVEINLIILSKENNQYIEYTYRQSPGKIVKKIKQMPTEREPWGTALYDKYIVNKVSNLEGKCFIVLDSAKHMTKYLKQKLPTAYRKTPRPQPGALQYNVTENLSTFDAPSNSAVIGRIKPSTYGDGVGAQSRATILQWPC
ncbi:MAG: hypothetical protein GY730_07795 [bacterium]|nr:hypothetical protein [bacterium]